MTALYVWFWSYFGRKSFGFIYIFSQGSPEFLYWRKDGYNDKSNDYELHNDDVYCEKESSQSRKLQNTWFWYLFSIKSNFKILPVHQHFCPSTLMFFLNLLSPSLGRTSLAFLLIFRIYIPKSVKTGTLVNVTGVISHNTNN